MIFRPHRVLIGSPNVDVWNHAWGPWWWWSAFSQGALPWRTALLQAPNGGVLWFIDPLLAFVGTPFVATLGPILAYNIVMFAEVVFISWAGRLLATRMGASDAASWVSAVGLACSAWVVCELHNGISEAVNIGPVALALAWGETASKRPTFRNWLLAGCGVGLAVLASPYLGLGVGLVMLVRGLPAIKHAWMGGLTALCISAPPLLALRGQLEHPDAIIKHPESMNLELALHNAVDPRTFVAPFGFRSVDLSAEGFEHSLYLGLAALTLAVIGLTTKRTATRWWLAAIVVSLLCALGPYLYWGEGWLLINNARIRLPWWALQQLAPGLAVTHPLRLGVPALAIISALAALGADRLLGARSTWLAVLVGVDALLISGAPWPIANAPAKPPAVYEHVVANTNDETAIVLDLPTDAGATMRTSRYLFWQAAAHHQPIPYGPDARANTSALINTPAFQALAQYCRRRDDERIASPPSQAAAHPSTLRTRGVRWIVLHPAVDPEAFPDLNQYLQENLGNPLDIEGTLLWDLESSSDNTLPR